jgi:DNA-binding GntR family transcriptional regulator
LKRAVATPRSSRGSVRTARARNAAAAENEAAATHGPSSPDRVVEAIKRGILLGRLLPGQRLIEAEMTRDHAVSRGPVREALKRLAAEGVVELSRHRGAFIRRLTRRQMLELLLVLEGVVGLAVRHAALCMKKKPEHRARLEAAYEKLQEHGPTGDRGRQSMDRNGFYDAIFAIADNRELARIHPAVPTQILRLQVYPYLSRENRQRQFADYTLLYEALCSGDSRAAWRVVVRHVRRSRMQVRRLPAEAFAPA